MSGRKSLALLRHHAMPMEIAVRSDVHHDFKSKVCVLKGTANLLPSRRTSLEVSFEHVPPLSIIKGFRGAQRLIPASASLLKQYCGQNLCFRLRIKLDETNFSFGGPVRHPVAYQ